MKPRITSIFGRFSSVPLYNTESLRNLSRMAILLVVALGLAGCATQQLVTAGPWTVEVSTSGGLSGRGAGSYAVTSEGTITVVTPERRTCTFQATGEELSRITRLLADSRPERWAVDYLPEETCCDRFGWTLTLTTPERTFTTRWIDAPEPMPAPLVALASAIAWNGDRTNVRHVYGSRCQSR